MKKPPLSVVIPTYNGEKTIRRLLLSINSCSLAKDIEIVILDSQSTDNTLLEIRKVHNLNIHIITIQKNKFNHGLTRNCGAQVSKSDYVFFLTQDAEILSKDVFQRMIDNFSHTDAVVIFGQQIPREETPLMQRLESTIYFEKLNMYVDRKNGLLVQNRNKPFIDYRRNNGMLWWFSSDVCACYRKEYILKHPFEKTEYGEDIIFGKNVIENGETKIYDSRTLVAHSHNLSYADYFKREREDMKVVIKKLGAQKKNSFIPKFFYILSHKEKNIFIKAKNIAEFLFYYIMKCIIIISLSL
jgi:rhamnosyltransferase